ncbi:MAG: TIM44-like domain-containing protein [Clostridia bacterium]|nr:TIM44-like domain-containing protein [Clostridia bacterium]
MIKRLMAVLLSLLLIFGAVHMIAHADFGDYGGDSDFGGGDFDWGGNDYDWGDDDDDDDDNDGNYFIGGSGGSGGADSSGSSILGGVILLAIIIFIIYRNSKKKGGSAAVMPGAQATDPSTLRAVAEYLALDPQFSEAEFREKLSNMYVQFQNAWQSKDLLPLRPYLTDAFYNKCDRQLDAYRKNKQTNRVERISVLGVDLVGWKQEADTDVMVARLRTRIVDYVTDDATGNVVRGSSTAEKFMEYEWDLVRSSGRTTDTATGTTVQSCPHCGAPIDVNHTAVCEYCGSVLTTDTFDWAVREIKGLSQRTAG